MDNFNYPPGSDTADAPWNQPDADVYTCESCDDEFEHEDDGYMSEAGFECQTCFDERQSVSRADFLASNQIARNYPNLDRHVKMLQDDPAGFYRACKDDPDSLYQ